VVGAFLYDMVIPGFDVCPDRQSPFRAGGRTVGYGTLIARIEQISPDFSGSLIKSWLIPY